MSQLHKVSENNTTIVKDGGKTAITLHSTPVVSFDDKTITLDNGGWITATTCARMTQASRQFDLGYSVGRKKGIMHVHFKGKEYTFGNSNTVTLKR